MTARAPSPRARHAVDAGPTTTVDEQQLDCERDGYPCSWAEADPAAAVRTDQLLAFSSLLLADGATADELAGRLKAAPGVAEVIADAITVSFRVDGAMPVFVYVDPTDGGLIEGAVPPIDDGDPALGSTPSDPGGCDVAVHGLPVDDRRSI